MSHFLPFKAIPGETIQGYLRTRKELYGLEWVEYLDLRAIDELLAINYRLVSALSLLKDKPKLYPELVIVREFGDLAAYALTEAGDL